MIRLNRLRDMVRPRPDPAPLAPVTLLPIGVVHSSLRDLRHRDTRGQRAEIRLDAAHATAIDGLDGFSHAIVITWLDRVSDAERSIVRERPGSDSLLPEIGVFALRTHHRPNPIGVTVVRISRVDGNVVGVIGLDVVDGTPVLDIKPYVPVYDSVPDARLPAWATGASR